MSSIRRWWWLGLAMALGFAAWLMLGPGRAKAVDTRTVTRGTIVQTLVATGRVAASARIELGVEANGTIAEVRVDEGDTVRAGQLLLRLRDDEARAALAQAEATLAEARARAVQLDQVGEPVSAAAVAQAEANLRTAQADRERAAELVARGFFAQQKVDEAQRTLDNARSALDAARTQAQANRAGGVERQLAQARVAQAQAAVEAARARLARLSITAPVDAVVVSRSAEAGALAQPGRVLLVIAQTGELRIDARLDERHLPLLKPGLAARVAADAYPSQPFDAVLQLIAPAVDAQRGAVEVRLAIPKVPPFVRPDMTVSADMQVGTRADALVLEADAVRDAERAPWALVIRKGRAERVPLRLGLSGAGSVEVIEGLSEGDAVIVQSAAASEGERVRARPAAPRPRGIEVPGGLGR